LAALVGIGLGTINERAVDAKCDELRAKLKARLASLGAVAPRAGLCDHNLRTASG
jgi:hypothetical protein